MLIRVVGAETLGRCPAAVYRTVPPVYEINVDAWAALTDYERRFILAHEMGHAALATDSEEAADRYALHLCAGSEPRSLKKSVRTLFNMGCLPPARVAALYRECQRIDNPQKNQDIMRKQVLFRNYATGDVASQGTDAERDELTQASVVLGNIVDGRRAGIRLNRTFVSLEAISGVLCACLLLFIAVKAAKRR